MEKVKIKTEFIKLDQFLKWTGIADYGSDAKELIYDGKVKVNGEIEIKRGRKLRIDDVVEYDGKAFRIE